ncbi:MAG: ribonuclease HII [Bacteroidota bacterium]|jgi:ribonuclease HII|nr:ribonuclease HII [Saprospiraceae bacterium]
MIAHFQTVHIEAGCDEAGRGCLAGPVFAAAVILPADFHHPLLNDSKKLTEARRNLLREVIEREAADWAVAEVSAAEIDQINILNSAFMAMHRALDGLSRLAPAFVIVDGNRFRPYNGLPYECIVKGDGKYASIAAASILAKTWRDEAMRTLHQQYPQYGWIENKGYPTEAHREAIRSFGPSPWHRKSFRLLPDEVRLELF